MKKEIIINSTYSESKVAITEDGKLAEYFIDVPDKERLVGSIFLGKVQKIVQGMNAAFIDIGLPQDAFLHFSDVDSGMEEAFLTEEDDEEDLLDNELEPVQQMTENAAEALRINKNLSRPQSKKPLPTFVTKRSGEVTINIESKQNVLVQVVREAYANKGVRVSTRISFPGRFVVLMPFENVIGISRKIQSVHERRRLRSLARQVLPPGAGCIIRTAAQNQTEVELKKDWETLLTIWKEVEQKVKEAQKPTLLYKDVSITNTVIRDLLDKDVSRVAVDNLKLFKDIQNYVSANAPSLISKIEHYPYKQSIFETTGLAKDIETIFSKKVYLPSGGYIIFDPTEAMLVIDVNTGRATFDSDQENNAIKTNLEAAREISRQMRLRDIGGMIVIDFIDMVEDNNRRKLYNEFRRELSRDRAKTVVYPLTQLGLLQVTRQRVRQSIMEWVSDECPTCNGSGRIQSKGMVVNSIENWLTEFRSKSREFKLVLMVHPQISTYLSDGSFSKLTKLMLRFFVKITIQPSEHIAMDDFKFISVKNQRDITQEYSS